MTLTREDLIGRGVETMGGHIGSISSGTSTAAVLGGLIDSTGDDAAFVGWKLFMLDAATEADRERIVTRWDDSTGTAHFSKARSDTTYTSESFILAPPEYSLVEYRSALNKALRQTKRSYQYRLPLIPGIADYSLDRLTWLEGADDIDEVFVGMSPNMLHNEDFEFWDAGSSSAPDGWTLAGSGATVARASTGIRSPYAATVTRASNDATLYQDVPAALVQYLTRSTSAPLPEVSYGAWVTSSTASIARIGAYNGSSTDWSSYYTLSSGVPVFLEGTYQTTATDTALRLVCSVDTTNGSATFHAAVLTHITDLPDQLKDKGSKSYMEHKPYVVQRNRGGWPVIELSDNNDYGQLIIHCRRPFPVMSADTDVVEDQYGDALVAGMLRWLTDPFKLNEDRTRPDRIRGEQAAMWARATKKFVEKPVQPPPTQTRVGGI